MWNQKIDISGTNYTQTMDEKTTRYTNLVNKAERINRNQGGKPSKEEANFYYEASKVCDEIMNMNLSQRAVYAQWKYRKLDCEENIKRIADILAPAPPAPDPDRIAQKIQDQGKYGSDSRGASRSKSGFTTEYASKDVPVEMIEKWFKDASGKGFEGVIGRTDLKNRLMNEAAGFGWNKVDAALDIDPVQCYFLYGPPGTGKTHLIEAFASELKKKGFGFMQLKGSEIRSSFVGVAEKIVTAAFAVAAEKEPCLIFIDEIDLLCVNRNGKAEGHEQRLTGAFLEAYNDFKKSGKRLIFMGATNHPGNVDVAMMDRVSLIRIPLPAEEDRLIYFERMVNGTDGQAAAKLTLEEGFTAAEMAAATDNHSYRDLNRLKASMRAKLKAQAIAQYPVLDPEGNVDQKATDERASKAIIDGEVVLTRALFEQSRKENPLSDKTEIRRELEEFEKRVAVVSD